MCVYIEMSQIMLKVLLPVCVKTYFCALLQRIDGRECYDYRQLKITFGIDRGCCHVELGKTR